MTYKEKSRLREEARKAERRARIRAGLKKAALMAARALFELSMVIAFLLFFVSIASERADGTPPVGLMFGSVIWLAVTANIYDYTHKDEEEETDQ